MHEGISKRHKPTSADGRGLQGVTTTRPGQSQRGSKGPAITPLNASGRAPLKSPVKGRTSRNSVSAGPSPEGRTPFGQGGNGEGQGGINGEGQVSCTRLFVINLLLINYLVKYFRSGLGLSITWIIRPRRDGHGREGIVRAKEGMVRRRGGNGKRQVVDYCSISH
jgi:hypothetical protein